MVSGCPVLSALWPLGFRLSLYVSSKDGLHRQWLELITGPSFQQGGEVFPVCLFLHPGSHPRLRQVPSFGAGV